MFFRKQPSPFKEKEHHSGKTKETKTQIIVPIISLQVRSYVLGFVALLVWFFALRSFFQLSSPHTTNHYQPLHRHQIPARISIRHRQDNAKSYTAETSKPICHGTVSVYVYDLPAKFNKGMLNNCSNLNIYTNMCPHVANSGLGQPLPPTRIFSGDEISSSGPIWFATHQFLAEMIFHARMERHPCRTQDPSRATVFYVPFYGGLHASSKFREANLTTRDELAVQLFEYLQSQPWYRRNNGKDHFLVLGRTAWDFMRNKNVPDFGANSLLNLPASKNMSVLTVERNPWRGSNQYGIPYSTYFHPHSSYQMAAWQKKMMESPRPHLFSFIGGPRKGVEKAAVRDELIRQCGESSKCELVKCGSNGNSKCHSPSEVLRVMSNSQFCLQAPGDSFTRRSTFDSMLAGCIPVFVSPHTAYTQYSWYLPKDRNRYSVYIEGVEEKGKLNVNIEELLSRISSEKIENMRRLIVHEIVPRNTYVHPNASDVGFKDAVDVALVSVAKIVRSKLEVETIS